LEPIDAESRAARRWPWGIVLGLTLVVLVNAVFAYLAIHGADHVVSSYRTEPR
jgi:hypothetical protein